MKTSVNTMKSSDALARKRAATAREERRKGRHPRRKERRDARGDAKGQQRKSGADARPARRKQGGGGLSHLDRGAFSANSSAPPGSKHTMVVSKKPQSVV